jgi:formyl-CoA transferase/CoA:oxalate CoA-transferase
MDGSELLDQSDPVGPLAGVRVVDFTRILSGPYCSLLLADLGAQVVKVERSDRGDDTRSWGPPFLDTDHELSTYFAALNRGKQSIAVDFRAASTRDLLLRLCEQADVVIENFRPGITQKLGLSWPILRERNPRLVLCSISGFGESGPYSDLPATEIVVEAMSGLMQITGPMDGDPVRFGIAMVDIATGLTAASKIIASLMVARETGEGTHVDCSLYATALAALSTSTAAYFATQQEPHRWGPHHPSIVPYGGFATSDGYLMTGVLNDVAWSSFCEALGLDDMANDPLYRTNAARVERRDEVQAALSNRCRQQPTDYWVERLRQRGLLGAPIRTVGQAVDDPATQEMGLFVKLEGFPDGYSTKLDGNRAPDKPQPVPRLGAHTFEILTDLLGLNEREVNQLLASGGVKGAKAPDG